MRLIFELIILVALSVLAVRYYHLSRQSEEFQRQCQELIEEIHKFKVVLKDLDLNGSDKEIPPPVKIVATATPFQVAEIEAKRLIGEVGVV